MQTYDVVIMGAGMSGLCMAVALKKAGMQRFVVIEKSAGLGGTWWDNRYPGAHVDVPAPLYSFSFAPNPKWTRRFAAAAEIQAYMADVAQRFGVLEHFQFNTQVSAARFDEAQGCWNVDIKEPHQAGKTLKAQFFVCSTGPLSKPRWPDIPQLRRFGGVLMHTARWDTQQPLKGQRIGIIGTGSTAAQLVAPLADQASHLTVFQRTPAWVLPRADRRYGRIDHWVARRPWLHAAVRKGWYELLEWGRKGFDEGTAARSTLMRTAQTHLWRQVRDDTLREQLTPKMPLGCKRLIYASDYYPALSRPHVALVTTAIKHATSSGLVTTDGKAHKLDVLVCATGFDVQHSLAHVPIVGTAGRSLDEAWAEAPQAHLGLTVAGFPNLFLMLGPNTATGHTSTLLFIEPAVQWVLKAMQAVQDRGQRSIVVKAEAMQAFNQQLQQRLQAAVWNQCNNWYRADNGRNIAIWPGFTNDYVNAVRRQPFEDFDFG